MGEAQGRYHLTSFPRKRESTGSKEVPCVWGLRRVVSVHQGLVCRLFVYGRTFRCRRDARVGDVRRLLGGEMTSGNIQMGPDPDRVMDALKEALRDDPKMRERPAEEVAGELARGGYLDEEPDPVLVAEMLGSIDPEGPGRETDELTEEIG